jgi:hypothetical protein
VSWSPPAAAPARGPAHTCHRGGRPGAVRCFWSRFPALLPVLCSRAGTLETAFQWDIITTARQNQVPAQPVWRKGGLEAGVPSPSGPHAGGKATAPGHQQTPAQGGSPKWIFFDRKLWSQPPTRFWPLYFGKGICRAACPPPKSSAGHRVTGVSLGASLGGPPQNLSSDGWSLSCQATMAQVGQLKTSALCGT